MLLEKFTPLVKILHCRRQLRHGQISALLFFFSCFVLFTQFCASFFAVERNLWFIETKCKINCECLQGTSEHHDLKLANAQKKFCPTTGRRFHFLAHANLSLFAELFCEKIAQICQKLPSEWNCFSVCDLCFFSDHANSMLVNWIKRKWRVSK